jgi:apolipoprotein N-acyltransferase
VVVDHRGTVLARSPAFQADVLSATVQPMQGATPYIKFGNVPVILLLLVGLTMLIRRGRKVSTGS